MEEQDPEQLLNHIFHRTNANWGVIISLRTMMAAGLPTARAAIEASNAEFIQRQLSGGERSIFIDPSKVVADLAQGLVRGMTEITLTQAQASVDAASLIFAHSVLDGVVSETTAALVQDREAQRRSLRDRLAALETRRGSGPVHADAETITARLARLDDLLRRDVPRVNAFFRAHVAPISCAPIWEGGRKFYRATVAAKGAEIIKSLGLAQAFDFGGCGGWI